MSVEKASKNPSQSHGFSYGNSPAKDKKSEERRGIASACRTNEGLYGHTPSYHKHAETLWTEWDKVINNPHHPGTQIYEQKRREGSERHARVHQTPVSKLEIDRLKAERAKAQAQLHLTPNGSDAAYIRTQQEAEREQRIDFQEKRLALQKGLSRRDFEPASKAQVRGPMRGPSR